MPVPFRGLSGAQYGAERKDIVYDVTTKVFEKAAETRLLYRKEADALRYAKKTNRRCSPVFLPRTENANESVKMQYICAAAVFSLAA